MCANLFFFLQNCIIYKRKWLSYICCREISLVIWHEWCLGVGAYRSEVMHRKPLLGSPKQVHSCINGEEKMTCDDSLCIVNQGKEKGESKWSCSRRTDRSEFTQANLTPLPFPVCTDFDHHHLWSSLHVGYPPDHQKKKPRVVRFRPLLVLI